LGGVQVLVDGIPCPLLFVSASQINAIVPYSLDKAASAIVVVRYQGVDSASVPVDSAPSASAVFTAASNGQGQASVLNQDQSQNTPANPADKGSIVSVFDTGEGQTNPSGIDGLIALPGLLPRPLLPVSAQVGGIDAEISYAGAAPGLVAGGFQINLKIPPNAPSGAVPIQIKVGEAVSQSGITVSIR
jgi:uncharacterized protein (TIGR03437 family)